MEDEEDDSFETLLNQNTIIASEYTKLNNKYLDLLNQSQVTNTSSLIKNKIESENFSKTQNIIELLFERSAEIEQLKEKNNELMQKLEEAKKINDAFVKNSRILFFDKNSEIEKNENEELSEEKLKITNEDLTKTILGHQKNEELLLTKQKETVENLKNA